MDKDTKGLILALVVIVIVAIVAFNFQAYTGNLIDVRGLANYEVTTRGGLVSSNIEESVSKIYVSTNLDVVDEDNPTIFAGEKFYVTVETGSQGSDNRLRAYSKDDFFQGGTRVFLKPCSDNCNRNRVVSAEILSSSSWGDGEYCVSVRDGLTKQEVERCGIHISS